MPRDYTKARKLLEGFDIAAYKECEKLSLAGWHGQLWVRYMVFEFINRGFDRKFIEQSIKNIRKSPLRALNQDINHSPFVMAGYPTLEETSARDVCSLYYYLSLHRGDIVDSFNESIGYYHQSVGLKYEDTGGDEVFKSLFSLEIGMTPEDIDRLPVHLNVCLEATDDDLKTAFSEWLASARRRISETVKNANTERTFEKTTPQYWCKLRLLAYLDILITSTFYNTFIPYHIVAEYLYEDEEHTDVDLGARVQKVVRPKALSLISKQSLAQIGAAARVRNQESKTAE